MREIRQKVSIVAANQTGVLARITAFLSRCGINTESLSAEIVKESGLSSIHIFMNGDESVIRYIPKQLEKQVDILSVVVDDLA